MKKVTLLIAICCQVLSVVAQKDAPKWADKVKKAIVSVETFDKEGKKLRSGTGFFINETGEVVSDYALFLGADKATVTDIEGKQLPVTTILGADELYDVVKFKVTVPKKVTALSLAQEPVEVGTVVYMLPYSAGKIATFTQGPVVEVSKVKEPYGYYKLEIPLTDANVSAPVFTPTGEVLGLAQTDVSKKENSSYAISAAFVNSLNVGTSDAFNKTYTQIGIKKAWPVNVEDALVALFLGSGSKSAQEYLDMVNDFIATFPQASEGYMNRASHYAFNRATLSQNPQEILLAAKEDMNTALKYSQSKGDSYYNQAKLIYGVAVSDSTLTDKDWSIPAALEILQKAISAEDLPIYRQLEADINFSLKEYEKAFNLYSIVNSSASASATSYYWAAKAKQNIEGTSIGDVIALLDSAAAKCETTIPKEAAPYILESVELKMQLGLYKEAVADYDKYYGLMGGQVADAFYYYREQAKFRLGDLDGALQDINQALKLSPADESYYAEQASIYVRQKKYDEAQKSIAKALEIAPDFAACYRLKGVCFVRQEKKTEACEAFTKAKELGDPLADKLIKENCK